MEMVCLAGATDWFWNMPTKMKTVRLCNYYLPELHKSIQTYSAVRTHSMLGQYLPYLKVASTKAIATERGRFLLLEEKPLPQQTPGWASEVPTWSQQTGTAQD